MSSLIPSFAVRVSPPGAGAIHLVWLGGPRAEEILRAILADCPADRPGRGPEEIQLGKLVFRGEALDEAMWRRLQPEESLVPGPVFEISLHGSPAVLESTLAALASLGAEILDLAGFFALAAACRPADRSRLEAWGALLEARSEAGAKLFLSQTDGAFFREIESLLDALAARVAPRLLLPRIENLLSRGRAAMALRFPQCVVLCGRPNAGKSTLFNALVGFERVLVSPLAGTTRDPVDEIVLVGGYPMRLVDTAGLRESEDTIEREGARLSLEAAHRADLAVFVWDGRVAWSRVEEDAISPLPREKTVAFPFRIDSLPDAVLRWESAVLDALRLPTPPPREGPCPCSLSQLERISAAQRYIESGRDPAPVLREILAGSSRSFSAGS